MASRLFPLVIKAESIHVSLSSDDNRADASAFWIPSLGYVFVTYSLQGSVESNRLRELARKATPKVIFAGQPNIQYGALLSMLVLGC